MSDSGKYSAQWLGNGQVAFAAMLSAIATAQRSVRLEMYICADCDLTRRFRSILLEARARGVKVSVMIDAFGSHELSDDFWRPLVEQGGLFKRFNPMGLHRIACRNHRKLMVCDDQVAFLGGFNLATEYDGDGITKGWRDLGLQISGRIAMELSESFDQLFEKAHARQPFWQRLRVHGAESITSGAQWKLLLNTPNFRRRMFKQTLGKDLEKAKSVRIISPYFLPTRKIRKSLIQLARDGRRVQLILAGKSDVRLAQLASQRIYGIFLRAGVEIYEYQPQILHSKLVILDEIAYAGSSNLDLRSLNFNYELMVRTSDPALVRGAEFLFEDDLKRCRRVTWPAWKEVRGWWTKLREHLAYFLLARLDPFIVHWQLKILR